MRPRTLTALSAAALAVAAPMVLAQSSLASATAAEVVRAPTGLYAFDCPSMELAPVEGQDGTYTLTQRLWSKKQRVQWVTTGKSPAVGSVPIARFAGFLARRATTDAAKAPVAHISYTQGSRRKDFLATVSAVAPGLGTAKAPAFTLTLSPLSPERLQEIAGGKGLLSRVATRCLKVVTAPPGAACTTAPTPSSRTPRPTVTLQSPSIGLICPSATPTGPQPSCTEDFPCP